MPEGDSLHRAARRLQVLVGEEVDAEAPHPRGAAVAAFVDGRRLVGARAVGKNLLLEFEGDVVVRSHLRMRGRWSVVPSGSKRVGRPWLVLRGREREAVLWNGPVLELERGRTARLGPDILAQRVDAARLRAVDQRREVGEVLLDQRVVSGIGNMWKAEALWAARVSPWWRLAETPDEELQRVLDEAARLMQASLEGGRPRRAVYRRRGRPCPRCGTPIASRGQGDDNRTAYWCPHCQP
jgi:endonuclease VIII